MNNAALLPVAERRAALEALHPTWEPALLHEVLDRAVERYADRPFVLTDERGWTYRELQEWSQEIARGLLATGVRPGEHVALVMANFAEFVAVKYAISRVGATCVPINFFNRTDELRYVLAQSDAVALVTMDRFRSLDYCAALDAIAPGWEKGGGGAELPLLRQVVVFPTEGGPGREGATTLVDVVGLGVGTELPVRPVQPSATADILYTSGTTGSPKGVLLTHDMETRTAYGAAYSRAFEDGRRVLFSLPMYHVYGYVEGLLAVPFVGGAIIPQRTFDARATVEAVTRHRATDLLLIPTMTLAVCDLLRAESGHDLSSLGSVISSGSWAPPGIFETIRELMGDVEMTTGYGMSETTATTTMTEPGGPWDRLVGTNGSLRPAGVAGSPELGGALTEYRVVHQVTGAVLPPGEVGELQARGPGITAGYYRKPEESAAVFDADGWFGSGDLGVFDADGFLVLVGRKKDLYRCGGEQVVPKEIEDVLLLHPAIAQAHVVPLRHDRMGEVGVAWVVFRPGLQASSEELATYSAERLARFKVPAHFRPLTAEEVPLTPSGRPRKFLLAARALQEITG